MVRRADENFVRRNLKRRAGPFKYKQSRRKLAQGGRSSLGSEALPCPPEGDRGMDDDEGEDTIMNRATSASLQFNAEERGNSLGQQEGPSGLALWGVDPLALSLNHIQAAPSSAPPAPSKISPPMATQPCIRGLTEAPKSKLKPLDLWFNPHWSKSADAQTLELMQSFAPPCPGHQMSSRLYTVRKPGPNRGRRFYSCCFPADQQCELFLWAEENPHLLDAHLGSSNLAETAATFAIASYTHRLSQLSRDSLVSEVHRFRSRRKANQAGPQTPLKVSGNRAEIESALVEEARWWLTQSLASFSSLLPLRECTEKKTPITAVACPPRSRAVQEEAEDDGLVYLSDSSDDSDSEISITKESHPPAAPPLPKANDALFTQSLSLSEGRKSTHACADEGTKEEDEERETEGEEEEELEGEEREGDEEDDDNDEVVEDFEYSDSDGDDLDAPTSSASEASCGTLQLLQRAARWFFALTVIKPLQREVMHKVCAGQSTLAVLPTGYGKSLCYLLPSIALPGLTLVVSPLLSLIRDQAAKLPCDFTCAVLAGSLGSTQYRRLVESILCGHVKCIYLSPERIISAAFERLLAALRARGGPEVSLLCIDEAHCMSSWSHLFRAAYLLLPRVVHRTVRPRTVLALTATAGLRVRRDICNALGIDLETGCVVDKSARENIRLSAMQRRENSVDQLAQQLQHPSSRCLTGNTIVYVSRRRDCDLLVQQLVHMHQLPAQSVHAYHAGMLGPEREKIERQFLRPGKAAVAATAEKGRVFQCVVATVAFGMGVDKRDVHRVVHYALPRSLEQYLQEIGRAGRDSSTLTQAQAILLYSMEDAREYCAQAYVHCPASLQVSALVALFVPLERHDKRHGCWAVELAAAREACDVADVVTETVACQLQSRGVLHVHSLTELECVTFQLRLTPVQRTEILRADGRTVEDAVLSRLVGLANNGEHATTVTHLCQYAGKMATARTSVLSALYSLQGRGILHYVLSSPAIVFELVEENTSTCPYESWLSTTSEAIREEVVGAMTAETSRAITMYRYAEVVRKMTDVAQLDTHLADSTSLQHLAWRLLDDPQEVDQCKELGETCPCVAAFRGTEPPALLLDAASRHEVEESVQVLARDKELLRLCAHLSCSVALERNRALADKRRALFAHYIVRILLALPSPSLCFRPPMNFPSSSSAGETEAHGQGGLKLAPGTPALKTMVCVEYNAALREHWGRLRGRVDFSELHVCVLDVLRGLYTAP